MDLLLSIYIVIICAVLLMFSAEDESVAGIIASLIGVGYSAVSAFHGLVAASYHG